MQNLKMLAAFALCAAGVLVGLYVGIWWAFVGGLLQAIHACKGASINDGLLAWGVSKMLASTFLGYLSALPLWLPGVWLGSSVVNKAVKKAMVKKYPWIRS